MDLRKSNKPLSIENSSAFKKFITEQPIGSVMTAGILAGWALCFVLICFIIGGSIDDILHMDEVAFRTVLFISFPMGAILGSAFMFIVRKSIKDAESKESPKEFQHRDNVTKLKELKELMDAGVLTQEEFDAQKEKILNS